MSSGSVDLGANVSSGGGGGGAVDSFNGRTGDVISQFGDYPRAKGGTGSTTGNILYTQNIVKVKQNPDTGEFSSVAAAIASITTADPTTPITVVIGPGIYPEPQLVLKSYVSLSSESGSNQDVILVPINPDESFIVAADDTSMSNIVLTGATGPSGILVEYTALSDASSFLMKNCVFGAATTLAYASGGAAHETIFILENCVSFPDNIFTTGFKVTSTGSTRSRFIITSMILNTGHSLTLPTDFILASGDGSRVFLGDSFFIGSFDAGPSGNGNAIHLLNGADVTIIGSNFINMDKVIWAENSGSAPNIAVSGTHADSNNHDIVIEHTGCTGSIEGAFQASNSTINSSSVSFFTADPTDGITFTGDLTFGSTFDERENVTALVLQGPTMGLYAGGVLSSGGGFVVDVASGDGYVADGLGGVDKIVWSNTSITLSANVNAYIYFDQDGVLLSNATIPDTSLYLLLGRVVTNASTIEFIDASPMNASFYGNKNDSFIRNALGPVFQSGCIVSENATPKHLNVSAGSYYFGDNHFQPSAGTNVTFQTFYRNGSGGQVIGSTNVVDVNNYDNGSGTLAAIPALQFTKHGFYVVGEGANKQYLLVYGQSTYATLNLAEAASTPVAPSYFVDGVVLLSGIIVKQGSSSIVAGGGEIQDSRPRIGFAPAASSGTVSSVGLSLPSIFSVSGSPVTSAGTLSATLATQTANTFFAGATSGGAATPAFRAIVAGDIPTLNQNTTGSAASFTGTLVGDVTGTQGATAISSATVTAKLLTGYSVGANVVLASSDSILQAFGKLQGQISASVGAAITALSGDVVATGPGSSTATIQANVVSNAKLAQMAANTIKGNNTAGLANAADLTVTQTTAMLNPFIGDFGSGGTKGLVPAPPAGSSGTSFLNANGNFATAVTSIAIAVPSDMSVAGSPITTAGTITLSRNTQNANLMFAGPATGSAAIPTFRSMVVADALPLEIRYFGDGSDGNVTINSGTTTLTRDIFYNNLTINGTGALNTAGFKVFVAGILDLTAAPAGAIISNGGNGGSTAANTAGAAGTATALGTVGASGAGGAGGAGSATTGGNGVAGGASAVAIGSVGRVGAVGGTGANAAGTGGAAGAVTTRATNFRRLVTDMIYGITLATAGGGGGGGSGGGGDSAAHLSGGGGGGGGGGGLVYLAANVINRSGSTASLIQAMGGNGGNAGTANASSTNGGGGGGGSGGGGGGIYLAYGALTGSSVTGLLDASGGSGGTGGNGVVGNGGVGGGSGTGGQIIVVNINAATSTLNTGSAGVAGSAASGTTGGAGASVNTFQITL